MKLPSSILAIVLLGSVLSDAQTLRSLTLKTVYVSYLDTRSGTPTRTPHWVASPATSGAQLIARDASFWNTAHASYGTLALGGTPYPNWVDSSQRMGGTCSLSQIFVDAALAIGGTQVPMPPFGTVTKLPPGIVMVVVLPNGTPCNDTAGVNTIYTVNGSYIEHETGHVLGLQHPNQQHCTLVNNSPTCTIQSYSLYSIMGNGVDLNIFERLSIGALVPPYVLGTVTTSGDVTMQLSNTMTQGVKGVKISRTVTVPTTVNVFGGSWSTSSTDTDTLWVEYRNGDYASKGVILWGTGSLALIDLDRTTSTDRYRMQIGEMWSDGKIAVTLLSTTDTTATVHVDIAP